MGEEMEFSVSNEKISSDDGGVFYVTKIRIDEGRSIGSVVFLSGLFTGTNFWFSIKGKGLAAFFARKGYTCWVVERCGLGLARETQNEAVRLGLSEHVKFDLPKLQKQISAECSGPTFWVAHSYGGVVLAKALAVSLNLNQISGVVLVASQCELGSRALTPPLNILTKKISQVNRYFPARRLGVGSLDEPFDAIKEACDWATVSRKDEAFFAGFSKISVPVMSLVGAGDKSDPPEGCKRFVEKIASPNKEFKIIGKATGFSENYSHPGIIVSAGAQIEVWPMLDDWFNQCASGNNL